MKKIIVLGGGVAGMSAAHELIERGYAVEVYERKEKYCGGKARSIDYFGKGAEPFKMPLPGEHGFRFFPGFYRHVIDTMQRIPFTDGNGQEQTVFDNLVPTDRIMIARYGASPIVTPAHFPRSKSDWALVFSDMHGMHTGLTKVEIDCFSGKVWQLCTSSDVRRTNDYEGMGWWEFLEADRFPGKDGVPSPYQSLLVQGLTRTLVAARAETASTRTGGSIFLQLIYGMINPLENTDRVLDGPTNDRWLYAWRDYLIKKGVKYIQHAEVNSLTYKNNSIASATVTIGEAEPVEVSGDYFILAVPVERAAKLLNTDIINADKTLGYINTLAKSTSWMNGIQFYLNEDVAINRGHIIYSDTQWAITSISQVQFWDDYPLQGRGNGQVKGVLSVDISDWTAKGKFNNKPADECTAQEVADEVWKQMKASLNVEGEKEVLHDRMLVDWYLDRDIVHNPSVFDSTTNMSTDREPLLVNTVNSWSLRPESYCAIPNLFLASDYVRTNTDLATMEGANEAARRAVNSLMDRDGNEAKPCEIWPLKEPAMFQPLKWYDKKRWEKGLPWTDKYPWWLSLGFFLWSLLCGLIDFFKIITHTPSHPFSAAAKLEKQRTRFLLFVMPVSIACLALAAYTHGGAKSAALWSYGFALIYTLWAIWKKDSILKHFLLFSLAAGFAELLADAWIVGTNTLFYPENEPMLFKSPAYMPFSWLVVLIQLGYIGYLIHKRMGLPPAILLLGIMGCMIIPFYEYLAIHAGWWHYENAPMWGIVPKYIYLAEGILMLSIPLLFNGSALAPKAKTIVLGVLQGLVMLVASVIAYKLLGH